MELASNVWYEIRSQRGNTGRNHHPSSYLQCQTGWTLRLSERQKVPHTWHRKSFTTGNGCDLKISSAFLHESVLKEVDSQTKGNLGDQDQQLEYIRFLD